METKSVTLGDCPNCGSEISHGYLLIEYETGQGSDRFAECPDCLDVVHPA